MKRYVGIGDLIHTEQLDKLLYANGANIASMVAKIGELSVLRDYIGSVLCDETQTGKAYVSEARQVLAQLMRKYNPDIELIIDLVLIRVLGSLLFHSWKPRGISIKVPLNHIIANSLSFINDKNTLASDDQIASDRIQRLKDIFRPRLGSSQKSLGQMADALSSVSVPEEEPSPETEPTSDFVSWLNSGLWKKK